MAISIDVDRLWQRLSALGAVGAYHDVAAGVHGVNRLALTDADAAGRRLVEQWFSDAGLTVRVDQIGNVYGRRDGAQPDLPPVMAGSHIDSVPTGGRFDGALGVLGAVEVVQTLNDAGVETRRPIEIGFFTDEEGARFGTDMLGSAVACGRLALEDAYALTDETGATVRGELERIGFLGAAPVQIGAVHAYLECHIEQGPILAAESIDLGAVTGVQAISWQELTIEGKSAHAGTTPMNLRKDAGVAAAQINLHMHQMATSGSYGADMRATMGRIDPEPGRVNIVPGKLTCTVDLRNPDDEMMRSAESDLRGFIESLAQEMGVEIHARQTARTPSVRFDEALVARIDDNIAQLGLSRRRILSGAGHDAQEFAAICPTAMIFVPGEHDGISHNPREYSSKQACGRGVQVLANTLLDLAERCR